MILSAVCLSSNTWLNMEITLTRFRLTKERNLNTNTHRAQTGHRDLFGLVSSAAVIWIVTQD